MEPNKLMKERLEKLAWLRKQGIDPFAYRFDRTHSAEQINTDFSKLKKDEISKAKVSVAGRIMQFRRMGKASFMHLQDESGKVQIYLKEDDVGKDQYSLLKKFDIGDIIGVTGNVFRTKTKEITVYVKTFTILTKAIRPLPEKYHGLKDPELRYRMRYLDLIMNPDVQKTFKKRAKVLRAIRDFLHEQEFIEVQTPIIQTQYGGANARPFVSKINAWNMQVYLRIAYELHLKRLIVGGFEKIYDLSYCFRNEGADKTHNPEFTMIEMQWAYADYNDMMKLTEDLFEYVAKKVLGTTKLIYQGKTIDVKAPWIRMTVKEAIKKYAKIDVDKLSDEELFDLRITYNLPIEGDLNRGIMIMLLFEFLCEDKIMQPTHIIDHPKETCPLAKPHRKDPDLIERVEPFIFGWEMGNGYSELTDPIIQRKLLEEQAELGRGGDEEAHPMDEDYIRALEFGLPPNAGMGIGIDRMMMLFTDSESIRDVILFPTMRPEQASKPTREKKPGTTKQLMKEVERSFDPGITLQEAEALCAEHLSEATLEHVKNVEAVMRALAKELGEEKEEEVWALLGLLHDLDNELYEGDLEKHTIITEEMLSKKGVHEELIRAIKSHNEVLGIPRKRVMEKALYACDELTGLIHACSLVRPDKDIAKVKVSSVKKKMKDKSFARGVDRATIKTCEKELEIPIDDFIGIVLKAMQRRK